MLQRAAIGAGRDYPFVNHEYDVQRSGAQ